MQTIDLRNDERSELGAMCPECGLIHHVFGLLSHDRQPCLRCGCLFVQWLAEDAYYTEQMGKCPDCPRTLTITRNGLIAKRHRKVMNSLWCSGHGKPALRQQSRGTLGQGGQG